MGDRSRAVISIIGRDQKGVVARVSTYLASSNVNIEDIEQRVMEGLFIMTMLVDLSDLATTLDELVFGLRRIGEEINMEVTVRLAGGRPEPKRVAILVTREPHCLEELVREHEAGTLKGNLVVVLSNHPDLEPVARQHGIPFAWSPSTDKTAHEDFLLARLGDVDERGLVGPRDPHREAGAHDAPPATPGNRPGRKMTFRSFTISWSFRKSSTACVRTLASSARPRAFTSSSVSSPTRMWKTSWRTTGPASSCSVTKCAVQPDTRTPSSHACL